MNRVVKAHFKVYDDENRIVTVKIHPLGKCVIETNCESKELFPAELKIVNALLEHVEEINKPNRKVWRNRDDFVEQS